jgi:phosphomannomutase/phosphoglucomutase
MIAEDAAFGGELSGHYFYRELHGGDDGLYSALVVAGMLRRAGAKLSELSDSVPEYVTTPDIRLPVSGDRGALVERIAGAFPSGMVSRLDGVRVSFDDGWGLARVSVTEPVVTIRFEAASHERLHAIVREFLSPIPEVYQRVAELLADFGRR